MDKHVVLPNGTIDYDEVGEGYPLVLLHGALSNTNTWRKVIPGLSRHFRCIMPTLPLGGHRRPIHATTPITGRYIADLLHQFTQALHLDQFALLGNDTGGAYAQIFTSLHPERVSHLILTNCDGLEVFPPKLFATLPLGVRVWGFTGLMALAMRSPALAKSNLILGALTSTLDGRTLQSDYLHEFMTQPAVRRDFKMLALGWDSRETLAAAEQLKRFEKPVLLVWGLDDKALFPLSLGERIAAIFPNARLETVAGASTYIQEDRPGDLVATIEGFLVTDPVT
ncbi:MAG: alpha/beta hydrolase [Anaerolineae bacterium]|jgi:pimeloyl-ACP methyl ester carboxylesterase|nr:alpha/beta hydrolase [Anaerolineae bacterium]